MSMQRRSNTRSLELFPRESCHSLCREPFSPRGFLRGEKVAKPDEGGAYEICAIYRRWSESARRCANDILVKRPLIRLRHLLPQQETAGGEGLSIGGTAENEPLAQLHIVPSLATLCHIGSCEDSTLQRIPTGNVAQTLLSVPGGASRAVPRPPLPGAHRSVSQNTVVTIIRDAFSEEKSMRGSHYGFDLFDDCLTCTWRTEGFFCNIEPSVRLKFDAITFTNVYPDGAVLFSEGQPPRGIFLICHGRAKLSISSNEGKTLITKIAEAGEALGLSSSLSGNPYKTAAETLEPSQIKFVRRDDLLRFVGEHHQASASVILQLAAECEAGTDHIRAIELSHSAAGKLANLILSWCATQGKGCDPCRCQMLMTHEDLSQLIGTSRETVTRLLKEFRDRKLITLKGSALTVQNRAALEALVVL